MAEWPYNIPDYGRAVHFAVEKDCPYARPESCGVEKDVRQILWEYQKWAEAHYPATGKHRKVEE